MIGSILDQVEAARTTLTRASEDQGWQRAYDVLDSGSQAKVADAVEFDTGLTFVRPVSQPGALLIYPDLESAVDATGSPFNVRSATGGLYSTSTSASTQTISSLGLTTTELRMLRLLAHGRSNKEMAVDLGRAESTIKNRVSALFDKLGVQDRTQAALRALNLGLITFEQAGA